MVSGTISLPSRGAFHRSLTVLYAIGLTGVFSLAGWARQIRAGFHVSRVTQEYGRLQPASDKGLSPATVRLSRLFSSPNAYHSSDPTTPGAHRYAPGLGSSPFARHY